MAAAAAAAPPTALPSAPPVAAGGEAQVRAFLTSVYTDDLSANPTLKAQAVYDPALEAAMAEDARLASSRNTEPALVYDPISQSETPTVETWKITSVALSSPTAARANLVLDPAPAGYAPEPQTITVLLVETASGWRIHDISKPETPSLLDYLMKANKRRGGT